MADNVLYKIIVGVIILMILALTIVPVIMKRIHNRKLVEERVNINNTFVKWLNESIDILTRLDRWYDSVVTMPENEFGNIDVPGDTLYPILEHIDNLIEKLKDERLRYLRSTDQFKANANIMYENVINYLQFIRLSTLNLKTNEYIMRSKESLNGMKQQITSTIVNLRKLSIVKVVQ